MRIFGRRGAVGPGVARVCLAAIAALVLFGHPEPARAQQDVPDAARVVLAERLMALSQGPNITKQIESQVRETADQLTDLTPEQRSWVTANMPRMARTMMDALIEDLVQVCARTFTAQELQAQIDFYDSPVGRSIIEKSIAIGADQAVIMARHEGAFMTDLMTKFCQRFDCSAGTTGPKGG